MNKDNYAIIMAGGIGTRFWPISTSQFPKQFHDMLGTGQTLLQKTFSRLSQFVPEEHIFILTNTLYTNLVRKQLPQISSWQIVPEPAMRNTGPCILYAALKIQKENPKANIIVAPSDHWIENEEAFKHDVLKAFEFCENHDALMTLGIKPTFPNTGYGYIEYDNQDDKSIKKVNQFREKPDYQTAKSFIEQGNYLWNAGIFVWSAKSVIEAFKTHQPNLFSLFEAGNKVYNTSNEAQFIAENYAKAENISVDYAIMEQSENVYVLPATFDWSDLGTWGSLFDELPKDENNNVIVNSKVLAMDSKGNIIRTKPGKLVVMEDINDYIIVDKDDVLLIFPKDKEQDIKTLQRTVKENFGDDYI